MYLDYVYHLDLCMLAYQLYNQTLIWPLDPWYERLSRHGTSRRDNFMKAVHLYLSSKPNSNYRGPGSTRQWSTSTQLNPILSDYSLINPQRACFTYDGNKYRYFKAPEYITNDIGTAYMCELIREQQAQLKRIWEKPGARDELYCFEGGTGVTPTNPNAAYSLMGFVLKRYHGNKYDLHIAFRGSQSGSAVREANKGLGNAGNPDWVTDMHNIKASAENEISIWGGVCKGFGLSLKKCLPAITKCLETIDSAIGDPENIYVTGHSLGGALASLFASAMIMGNYGAELQRKSPRWPWEKLKLFTYGAPTVGGKKFHSAFNLRVNGKRIWVHHDTITQKMVNYPVGAEVVMDGGYTAHTSFEAHEPSKIRKCLIELGKQINKDQVRDVPKEEPWKAYKTFTDMYNGEDLRDDKLKEILTDKFNNNIDLFLKIFKTILSESSTYKGVIRHSESEKRKMKLNEIFDCQREFSMTELAERIKNLETIQDGMAKYLGLCLILKVLKMNRKNFIIRNAFNDPRISSCLNSND